MHSRFFERILKVVRKIFRPIWWCIGMFSVIIITRDRLALLQKCLDSLQVFKAALKFELIVVLNGEDPLTHAFLNDKPDVTFIYSIQALSPGAARNLALESVTKEWTFFIDDDAQIPADYFSYALKLLKDLPKAQVIGGSDTYPQDSHGLALATSLTLESPLCTGLTARRHSQAGERPVKADETSLTSCNLWVRSHWWLKGLRFPENYIRGEETVLLKKISLQTDELWYVPTLRVHHQRRDNMKSIVRASYRGGYYRARTLREFGGDWWFWLAPLFVVLHFSIIAMPPFFYGCVILWLILVAVASLKIALENKKYSSFFYMIALHWIILFTYGLGFIKFQIDDWSGGES